MRGFCHYLTITIICRLESLCKSDSAKVRLRLGNTAATFSLNSSLVPGALFNCHLELALDSSKLGNDKIQISDKYTALLTDVENLALLLSQ